MVLAAPVSAAPVAAPMIDAARVNAARDDVLASAEFAVTPDWRTRFLDEVIAFIERSSAWLPGGLRLVALFILLAAVIGLILWLVPRASDAAEAPTAASAGRAWGDFARQRALAEAALADGRWADCARAAWLGALGLLERAGISRALPTRADWEHVEAARRKRGDVAELLQPLVLVFQRSHFGAVPVARDDAARCLALLGQLERSLGA